MSALGPSHSPTEQVALRGVMFFGLDACLKEDEEVSHSVTQSQSVELRAGHPSILCRDA